MTCKIKNFENYFTFVSQVWFIDGSSLAKKLCMSILYPGSMNHRRWFSPLMNGCFWQLLRELLLTTACSAKTVGVKCLSLSSGGNSQEILFFPQQLNKCFQGRLYFKSTNFLVYQFLGVQSYVFCSSTTWYHVGPVEALEQRQIVSKDELTEEEEVPETKTSWYPVCHNYSWWRSFSSYTIS